MRFWRRLGMALLVMAGGTVSAQHLDPLAPVQVASHDAPAKTNVPPPAGAHSLDAGDVNAWLDGYMPFALRSGDIAGAVVVVVKDGAVLAARGYCYADIAKRTPVDPYRTLFRPGSVSKLITWTAVMRSG